MDASKAFEKIHFEKFSLLLEKKMPSLFIRILLNMYENQVISTEWNGVMSSSPFKVSNGVYQGGVISGILFTIYMDVLLKILHNSDIGCHIGHYYTGAIAYANDLILLCPSRDGLQRMLHICDEYGKEYFVSYNSKKTKCIVFSKHCVNNISPLGLNNEPLKWVDHVEYLGNELVYNLKDDRDIFAKRSKFFWQFNSLMSIFGSLSCDVINHLFGSYCCSFYGCQSWCLYNEFINKFATAYNKALRRMYRLPYNSHTRIVRELSQRYSLTDIIVQRFYKMLMSMINSYNNSLSFIAKQAMCNANTFLGRNIMFLYEHYHIEIELYKYATDVPIVYKEMKSVNAQIVRDCLEFRHGTAVISSLNDGDIHNIILYCSTMDIWNYDCM